MVQRKRAAQGSGSSGDELENMNLMQSPAKARCQRAASGDGEASSKDGSCASSPAKHRGAGQGGSLLQLAEAATAALQEDATGVQRSCPRCMQSFPVDGVQASSIQREKDPQRKIECGHFVCKECREAGDTWAQGQDARYQNMVKSYCGCSVAVCLVSEIKPHSLIPRRQVTICLVSRLPSAMPAQIVPAALKKATSLSRSQCITACFRTVFGSRGTGERIHERWHVVVLNPLEEGLDRIPLWRKPAATVACSRVNRQHKTHTEKDWNLGR